MQLQLLLLLQHASTSASCCCSACLLPTNRHACWWQLRRRRSRCCCCWELRWRWPHHSQQPGALFLRDGHPVAFIHGDELQRHCINLHSTQGAQGVTACV
jgi:hypothetical protein